MLSLRTCLFFKNHLFRGIVRNPFSVIHYFKLVKHYSYGILTGEDKRLPLSEINNIKPSSFNCDEEELFEVLKELSEAKNLPEYIRLSEIVDLIECESKRLRQRYINFLFKREIKKKNAFERRMKEKAEYQERKSELVETDHIRYGLGHNTLLLKAFRRRVINFYEKKLANSILFGQKIVIDLSYDEYMSRKARKSCVGQLRLLHSLNKYHQNPYDLYFCNANPENRCVQDLVGEMTTLNQKLRLLWEQSYLDLFPKENLVYLSPHASESLKSYDHNAIYIIGAFVDNEKKLPLSINKAEEGGIKSYSLPLDDYVLWGCGSRNLAINQVFSIMQTLRDTGDWKEAFKYVPPRKLKIVEKNSEENQFISDKLYVMSN